MPPTRSKPAAMSRAKGTFARLKAEAQKNLPPVEPYVIDDAEPPIHIYPPDDAERQFEASELFGHDGSFQMKDARRVLELICGDAFERVWELVRKEHITVALALIDDIGRHFQAQAAPADEVADFPGGSEASST